MRIAFLVPEFPSISQTFVLNQITGLIDRQHDVQIFALSEKKYDKNHDDVINYDLLKKTTYFPKIPGDRLSRLAKGIWYSICHFPKHPISILKAFNIFNYGKSAFSLPLIYRMIPFLGQAPFDVVLCHFGPMGDIAVKCRLSGALQGKIATVFHGYDLTSYPRQFGGQVYKLLFKHCDICLPISLYWKNKLIEMGCDERKIKVHRMGVDSKQFNNMNTHKRKNGSIRILSIARLVEKKGIEYGIKAISLICDRYPDIRYTIAGDGPLRAELQELIDRLNLSKNVQLLGWANQSEVTKLMLNSDILITPSITANNGDKEGIPVVLMEAQAMGLPVISTYHSGIPELIMDGHNGYLVEERNASALAEKILALIECESKIKDFKINGKKFVEKNYNINNLNSELEQIFSQMIRR